MDNARLVRIIKNQRQMIECGLLLNKPWMKVKARLFSDMDVAMKQTNILTRNGLTQDREALQEFGDHSFFIGDYRGTPRHYEKAAALNMHNPALHLGLFQASCHIGSFAKIIHTIEMYLKMHTNNSDTLFSCNALPKMTRLKIPKYSGYNPDQYFLTTKTPKVSMKKLNVT